MFAMKVGRAASFSAWMDIIYIIVHVNISRWNGMGNGYVPQNVKSTIFVGMLSVLCLLFQPSEVDGRMTTQK